MEEKFELALENLGAILQDSKASPATRLKAAMFIIDKALTPPPPRKQVPFDIGEVHFQAPVVTQNAQNVHDGAQSPQRPAAPQSEKPEIVHKNAQSAQPPYRREAPKVGRNEPCPCGSNLKFKRCCLGKAKLSMAA